MRTQLAGEERQGCCMFRFQTGVKYGRSEPMTDHEPTNATNLDRYGNAALSWSRPRDLLANPPQTGNPGGDRTTFLGSTRRDGRPHSAPIGALWDDGVFYFTSGPGTRKSRNLAANPACTISVRLEGIDLVLEGEATRI